jgi:hypothetical protein
MLSRDRTSYSFGVVAFPLQIMKCRRQREEHVKRKANESPRSSDKKQNRSSGDNLIQDNYRHSRHNRSRALG